VARVPKVLILSSERSELVEGCFATHHS